MQLDMCLKRFVFPSTLDAHFEQSLSQERFHLPHWNLTLFRNDTKGDFQINSEFFPSFIFIKLYL